LAALADLPEAELERWLEDDLGLPPGHLPSLLGRMDTAAVQSQLDNRFLAFASTAALFCDARAASSSSMAGALLSEGGCFAVPVLRGAARVSRWPTRLARKLAAAGDCLEMRDKVEDRERGRWVEALYLLLVRAQFPAVMDHAGQLTIPFSRKRFAKGRRPATLRKHVKTAEKLVDFCLRTFGDFWPRRVDQLLAYLEQRLAEPYAKSVPLSVLKTVMFFESAGEVQKDHQLAQSAAVKNFMEEVALVFRSQIAFKRKANQLLAKVVVAMEMVVLDSSETLYVRGFSWFKLLKLWTAMRWSDTTGLSPASIKFEKDRGLVARLDRTKTTGVGKRVELLHVFVSIHAWLVEPKWLETGLMVWRAMGESSQTADRDFFLPRPSLDLSTCLPRMAEYRHAANMSQALFNGLGTPTRDAESGLWRSDGVSLLATGAGVIWSEHSERATMTTWAHAAGVEQVTWKQMARWQPTTDEGYLRSVRGNVEAAQRRVAQEIKDGLGRRDFLDEQAVVQLVRDKMLSAGISGEDVEERCERLRYFSREGEEGLELPGVAEFLSEEGFSPAMLVGTSPAGSGPDAGDEDGEDLASDTEMQVHGGELASYVVSIVGKSRRLTLHKVGECFRTPGVHFREYADLGSAMPGREAYHRACKDCFPRLLREVSSSDESQNSSSDSGSVESSRLLRFWFRTARLPPLLGLFPGLLGIMAAFPGLGSPEAIQAALLLLRPDLLGLLSAKDVEAPTQARLALAKIKSVAKLAVLADTRQDLRTFCKDTLLLDPATDPRARVEVASVVEAWEAAQARLSSRNAAEAEATVNNVAKALPKTELGEIRNKFELTFEKLEDKVSPAAASLETLFEQVDQGEFKFMMLKEFASREDVEQEAWGAITLSGANLRIKRGGVDTGAPMLPEELRTKIKLVGNHFIFAKIRYPTRRELQDIGPGTFIRFVDYLLGEQVWGLEAKDEADRTVSKPSWKLLLSYQFQLLKAALRLVNDGAKLGDSLEKAAKDINLKERYFLTPMSVQALSGAMGSRVTRSRSPRRQPGNWKQLQGKGGKGSKAKGKDGGKGEKAGKGQQVHSETPDHRQICFAYNSPWEKCKGSCGRVHCCRVCFESHPMHLHGKKKGGEGKAEEAEEE
ncbi:unnamed protein product, partial [Polarella glacialis]